MALQGVEDVQLMESATRRTAASRKFLSGLAKCVEENVLMPLDDKASWKQVKEKGERLFKTEHGGSHEVFNQRPILEDIISSCVGDVRYLPELRDRFWKMQAFRWRDLVNEESMKRVSASHKPEYRPHGSDRAMAPWSEDQNRTLDEWNWVPPHRDHFDEDDNWDDDWPTSCRDIISSWDYDYYYSD